MIWSIAWKNLSRNKLRSAVVMAAVTIGMLSGSFTVALITGMAEDRTESLIANESSHIQIHHSQFPSNSEPEFRIENAAEIETALKRRHDYKAHTKRIKINAMVSSSGGGNAATFVNAIEPETEKTVTDIYKHLNDSVSNYFDVEFSNPVVISENLAKEMRFNRFTLNDASFEFLKARKIPSEIISKIKNIENESYRRYFDFKDTLINLIGKTEFEKHEYFIRQSAEYFRTNNRLMLTFMDTAGNQTAAVFRVCGIYKTTNSMYDAANVFVRHDDLERLSGYSINRPHEIAIVLNDISKSKQASEELRLQFPELSVKNWLELQPDVAFLAEYLDFYNYIIVGLILAALAFGIINTMLMAIMERTKELGMLAAIGMNKKRRFLMIMSETVFLTLVGAVFGMGFNILIMYLIGDSGIDFSKQMAEGMEAVGYSAVLYPKIYPSQYAGITILVIITAILSSIYPAIRALRLNPATAIRSDA